MRVRAQSAIGPHLISRHIVYFELNRFFCMASDTRPPLNQAGKPREKVALKPGFHLVDWHRLMAASTNFDCRKGGPPRRVSMEELSTHNTEFDAWTAYNGKVYNITQYMQYHPGGVKTLMSGAGKDCTKLFQKYHSWVNIENILAKCYVGPLGDLERTVKEKANEDSEGDDEDDYLRKERDKRHGRMTEMIAPSSKDKRDEKETEYDDDHKASRLPLDQAGANGDGKCSVPDKVRAALEQHSDDDDAPMDAKTRRNASYQTTTKKVPIKESSGDEEYVYREM